MTADPNQSITGVHFARISARTRRLAMDWGLVLASQGIEAVIDQEPEGGWALVVSGLDYDRAVSAIEQYRQENLGWRWQQPMLEGGLLFDWGSVAWVLLTGIFYWLSQVRAGFVAAGLMDGAALAHGEWWRLFTATLLHADLLHFASNAVFGFLLLGLAMGHYGTGVGLLAAFLAGAGGNIASWLVHGSTHHGLGASGVVMAGLGLLAVQSVDEFKHHPHRWRLAFGGLGGGLMLFVLLGVSPETDVIAHLGGFAGGILLGILLSLVPKLAQRPFVNLLAGLGFGATVIWTWLLALR